jgi:hypothetical protein
MLNYNDHIKSTSALFDRMIYMFLILTTITILCLPLTQSNNRFLISLEDDSFYYFETCRNIVLHGKVSFDEIHLTNGFHPLWMLILVPIFTLFNSFPDLPCRAAVIFQILLLLGTFLISYNISNRNVAKHIGIIGILLALYPGYTRTLICGMETGVTVFLYLLLVWVVVQNKLFSQPQLVSIRKFWLTGFLISLILLSRLDSILFIGLFFLVALKSYFKNWRLVRGKVISISAALVVPSIILCSTYLMWNEATFGHLMPISGSIKMDYSSIHFEPNWFLRLLQPAFIEYGSAIIIGILGIILSLLKVGRTITNYDYRAMLRITSLGYLIQILNIGLFSSWRAFWDWYFYLSFAVVLIIVPFIVKIIFEWLKIKPIMTLNNISKPLILITGCIFIVFSVLGHIIYYEKHLLPSKNSFKQSLMAAEYVRNHTNKNDILAMGDMCGLFGYYCDHKVIHLEGLVNDYDFKNVLATGTLKQYLKANKVQYLVAYVEFDSSVISNNYTSFKRVEPYHISYNGPRDSITVYKEDEIYRRTWVCNSTQTVFVIWKLRLESTVG